MTSRLTLTALTATLLLGRAEALDFAFAFGSKGTANGQFQAVSSVAIDPSGTVYVVDVDLGVSKFTAGGTFVARWSAGAVPRDVATDGSGNVFVADTGNCRIAKYGSGGTLLAAWPATPGCGSGDGQFGSGSPRGVAVDATGNVYAVDSSNYRVQKFDADGVFRAKWGSYGTGDGRFRFGTDMVGIAVDVEGNVYVGDAGNCRIQKFSPDGTFLGKFGSCGSGDGQFSSPYGVFGVAVDRLGTVYAADLGNYRVQSFGTDGTFRSTFGSSGSGAGQFGASGPRGIATSPGGDLYVADFGNARIQVFSSGAASCPALSVLPGYAASCSGTTEGDSCALSCATGYVGMPTPSSSICQPDGTWSQTTFLGCVLADCGSFARTGYQTTCDRTTYGGLCSIACDFANGYVGTPSAASSTCQASQQWSVSSASLTGCTIADCGLPDGATGYDVSCSGTAYGDTCAIACDTVGGYVGTPSIAATTCQVSGWSVDPAVATGCTPIDCGALSFANADSTDCTAHSHYLEGCTLGCVAGFSGSPTASCTAAGTWSTSGACDAIVEAPPGDPASESSGCGCTNSPASTLALWSALALALPRRRRRS